jgi:hypothetical protein
MDALYHGTQTLALKFPELPSQLKVPLVDQVLEEERPATSQSRPSAYFTADIPEQALVVQLGMHKEEIKNGALQSDQIYVFEVEAERRTSCPMILVQMVLVLLGTARFERARQFTGFYWNSDQAWYFRETLVPSLRIVRQVEFDRDPNEILKGIDDKYRVDSKRAQLYRSHL